MRTLRWLTRGRLALALLLTTPAGQALARLPAWPKAHSDLRANPEVVFGVLPNGLRYAIRRNLTPPGQVSLHMAVEVGSANETHDQEGLAHLIEHMAFRGSTHVADGEVTKTLERLGLRTRRRQRLDNQADHLLQVRPRQAGRAVVRHRPWPDARDRREPDAQSRGARHRAQGRPFRNRLARHAGRQGCRSPGRSPIRKPSLCSLAGRPTRRGRQSHPGSAAGVGTTLTIGRNARCWWWSGTWIRRSSRRRSRRRSPTGGAGESQGVILRRRRSPIAGKP